MAFWQFQLVAWNWPPDSSYSLKTSIYNTTGCYTEHHQTHNQPKAKTLQKLLKRNTATCWREIYQLLLNVVFFRRITLIFIATQPGPVAFPQLFDIEQQHEFITRQSHWSNLGLSALFKGTVVMTPRGDRTIKPQYHIIIKTLFYKRKNQITWEHTICLGVQRWNYCSCN